jgi:ornithine cyclodeaminase/alanine dehydrogenase-like protein (mu-crystallin family)
MHLLREEDVKALIGMPEALDAVELAFREQVAGTGINSPRHRVHQPNGVLHMMGGALTERGYWGCKVYTATRDGVRFCVLLYDVESGALRAMIEADYLGQLRTGAASGVATRYLARSDADTLALFGTGDQAETQLAAIARVRPLRLVRVYSRKPERREAFAKRMARNLNLNVQAADTPEAAMKGANIITTATTSREPVFPGSSIVAGMHINAAGSNSVARSELDRTTIKRATRIFTDDLMQARAESGDLVMAYERNALIWEQVRPLADVVGGITVGRATTNDVTLFESQGVALWDIALAATTYERALASNVGRNIPFGD